MAMSRLNSHRPAVQLVAVAILAAASFLAPLRADSAQKKAIRPINGQIFIVTAGRENIKLALVNLEVLPLQVMKEHVSMRAAAARLRLHEITPKHEQARGEMDAAKAAAEAAREKVKSAQLHDAKLAALAEEKEAIGAWQEKIRAAYKLSHEATLLMSPEYYVENLPAPIASVKTDADGRFVLNLPPGKYAFVASASRKLLSSDEHYVWAVEVDTAKVEQVMLSNDNLSSSICSACIVLGTRQ